MICENCRATNIKPKDVQYCIDCNSEICPNCYTEGESEDKSYIGKIYYCPGCVPESYEYPKGFHDFSKGKDVDEDTIKEWLEQVRKSIVLQDESFHFVGSGNTLVIGFQCGDEYFFVVAKNYKELSVLAKDISKVKFL